MRQDARENRERILAAAEVVFGTYGATGSTEDVARRAGVGIATVFRHYPTKQALVEAVLLRHFEHLGQQAGALADAGDPAAAWRTLIRTMIRSGATKLMLASMLTGSDGLPEPVAVAASRLRGAVDTVLQQAMQADAVRSGTTVEEVYLLIRGLAHAVAAEPTTAAVLERAIDVVLAGLATTTRIQAAETQVQGTKTRVQAAKTRVQAAKTQNGWPAGSA